MTDCSATTLQTYRSIAQCLSCFLRGLPRGERTDRQIRKNERCGGCKRWHAACFSARASDAHPERCQGSRMSAPVLRWSSAAPFALDDHRRYSQTQTVCVTRCVSPVC